MSNSAWTVTSHALTRRGQAEGLHPQDPDFISRRERLRTLIPEEVERARPLAQGQNIFKHPMRLQGKDRAEYRLYQGTHVLCYVVIGKTVITTLLPDDRQLATLEQLGELGCLRPADPTEEPPLEPAIEPAKPPAVAPAIVEAAPGPSGHVPAWVRKPGLRLHLLVDHDPSNPDEPTGSRLRRQWATRLARLRPALVVCSEKLLPGTIELVLLLNERTPAVGFVPHPSPRTAGPYHRLHPDAHAWWQELGAQAVAGRDDYVFLLSSRDARRFNAVLNPRLAGFPSENAPPSVHPGKAYRLGWDFREERLIASPYGP